MATMIPDRIPDDAPESERVIFDILRNSTHPDAKYWTVFCGAFADNPANPMRPRELDFVIFMEEDYCSVIYLEAKGGHYEIRDFSWYSASSGQLASPNPPEQARSGMYAFRNQFENPYFRGDSLISLGCAVAFTDWDVAFRERPRELAELITRRDARDEARLIERLSEYADNLRGDHVKARLRDNQAYCDTLNSMKNLRSDFIRAYMPFEEQEEDPVRIASVEIETLRLRLLELTIEQKLSLGMIELNDRNVIDGAAGTGKTVLAMELAKRRCEAGESVALLCSNSNLSARFERWVETLPKEGDGRIVTGTPATLPLKVLSGEARLRHQRRLDESPDLEGRLRRGFLSGEWEGFVEETVADLEDVELFDYLVVDEAQNLCDEVFLRLQDALLKGGIITGRWAMFGDFVNQKLIRDSVEGDGKEALREWVRTRVNGLFDTNWSNSFLEINCRNTQEIADEVAKLVRIESPPRRGVHGPLVQTRYYRTREELEETLDGLTRDWHEIGYQSRQMIVLSSGGATELDASRSYGGWELQNIRDAELATPQELEEVMWVSGDTSPRTLRYSEVYDFQGLESDLAILVLPVTKDQVVLAGGVTLPYEDHLNRVLYTGMSRATTMLIIVAHESYRGILENRRSLYEAVHAGAD